MKSLEELKAIRERMQGQIAFRSEGSDNIKVVVGMSDCGIENGARPVLLALADEVQKRNMYHVTVTQGGCIGLCQYEPIVEVIEPGKDKITYINMNPGKAAEVLEKHLVQGNVVEEYTLNALKL